MATAKLTFLAGIAREGEGGSVRGKIPAGLIKAINAKEGEAIEFKVHGTTLVGATILSKGEFRARQKERQSEAKQRQSDVKQATSSLKAKKKAKPVVKPVRRSSSPPPVKRSAKPVKKVVKPSKRRTEVEYEAPRIKKGSVLKKLKKKVRK